MTDHCPTCGAAVRIEASGVTHYMVPIDAERVRELEERIRELEAQLEGMWKATKGVMPDTGDLWLTPRMEREALEPPR